MLNRIKEKIKSLREREVPKASGNQLAYIKEFRKILNLSIPTDEKLRNYNVYEVHEETRALSRMLFEVKKYGDAKRIANYLHWKYFVFKEEL